MEANEYLKNNIMNKIFCYLLLFCVGCGRSQNVFNTPKEYKNYVIVSRELYKTDSIGISEKLNKMVGNHEEFFYSYSSEYVDTSKSRVLIDTILYNSEKNQLFVLATIEFNAKEYWKNVNGELKNLKNVKLYDGVGLYLKKLDNVSKIYRSYNVVAGGYSSIFDCKNRMKEIYFGEIPTFEQNGFNRYNIDDVRMWKEPMWHNF